MTLGPLIKDTYIETARHIPKHEKKESKYSPKEKATAVLVIATIALEGFGISMGIKKSIDKMEEYGSFAEKSNSPAANSEQMNTETTQFQSATAETTFEATTETATTAEATGGTAETAENALTQKVEKYEEAMEKYREMSVEEFEALPRDERLLYSQYIIDRTVSMGNYDNGYGEGMIGQNFRVEYTPTSVNNNGQQIIDNNLYAHQISYLQFEVVNDGMKKQYDVADGQKCLSSVFYSVNEHENISPGYTYDKAFKETLTDTAVMPDKQIATNTSKLLDGIDNSGDKTQYKIVTYYSESVTLYSRFIFHEFTNYDGTRQSIWLFDTQEFTLEALGE